MLLNRRICRSSISSIATPSERLPSIRVGEWRLDKTRSSLLRRVRDPRDEESWQEFFALYHPILVSYLRKEGLNDHDAADVVQTVFQSLLKKMPAFELNRDRGRFRTWLWRVMYNAVVDWRRRKGRQEKAEGQAYSSSASRPVPDEPDEWRNDLRKRVISFALERVKAKTQQKTWNCFQLHILDGQTSADVADALGITVNSVNVNCSRVLGRVRECCREYLEDLDDDTSIDLMSR